MCPQCDLRCPYWNNTAACSYVRASHLFDNNATVAFALFMSVWCKYYVIMTYCRCTFVLSEPVKCRDCVRDNINNCTHVLPIVGSLFLEFWKREQAGIQFRWNLINFEDEEEPPRPEYLMRLAGSRFKKIHKVSGVRITYTQIIICKTSGN